MGRESTHNRRSCARRKGGVETVNIEGEITGPVTHNALHLLRDRNSTLIMHRGAIKDIKTHGRFVVSAQAYLGRMLRHNQPFFGGMIKHGAVVNARTVVFPGIGVGVEVNQRQRAVFFRVGPQQGVRHKVIATE